jgi:hypothetical protein|uniref:Uncharacterized protein n=1 Tax=viral metagenome TaxID=1070528 RepID=A0A6C0J4Y8_9ZZZZ
MSSLATSINNLINEEVGKFIEKISNSFDIPKEELELLWNSDIKPITKKPEQNIPVENVIKPITKKPYQNIPVENVIKPITKKPYQNIPVENVIKPITKKPEQILSVESMSKPIIKKTPQAVVKPTEDEKCKGCPYVWSRGDKSGTTCGSIPKNGSIYCSRHKKYEGVETKAKKVLPTTNNKKTISSVTKKKGASPSKEVGLTLHKNKEIDKLWDPNTKMVFKSISEKIVIGKYEDGEVKNLSSVDIDCCKQYGFAFEEQKSSENDCINKLMNSIEKFKKEKDNTSEEIQDNTEKDKVETRIRRGPETKSPTPKKEKEKETNSIEEEEIQDNTEKDKVETRIRRGPETKPPTPKKEKEKETNSIEEEEILEEELPVEAETDITKTRIRKSPKTKSPTPKKEISPKKVLCDNAKHVKKTIDNAILTTNLKAGDVEQILGELQLNLGSDIDSDEDILDEEDIEEEF